MSLEIDFCSSIDVGFKRENNQDSILVNKDRKLFSVADGLGGHSSGEVASSMALEALDRFMCQGVDTVATSSFKKRPQKILKDAFEKTNKAVFSQGGKHLQLKGMGTTMVMIWFYESKCYIGNVGDSRAYLCRGDHFWQLTDDHSLDMLDLKRGFKVQERILTQKNHTLIQSVGLSDKIYVDVLSCDVQKNDIFLLCTDGLHGLVSDKEILGVLRSEKLKNVPKKCVIKALSMGGFDNIAVVAVQVVSC